MAEPDSLHCPHCGSSDVRPANRWSLVRDPRFQHCEQCGRNFTVPSRDEQRLVAHARFEADARAVEAEARRLRRELDALRRQSRK